MFNIPAWFTIELVLGIIGTLTGIMALILHFIRLQREKPRLKVMVNRCKHYTPSSMKDKVSKLRVEFQIHNIGDRGTQLSKLELSFEMGSKIWSGSNALDLVIEAHRSSVIDQIFFFDFPFTEQVLQCTFSLYHTHDKYSFKIKSIMSQEDFSRFGVAVLNW